MGSSKQENFDTHACYQEYFKRVDAFIGRITTSAKEDKWIEDLSAGLVRLIQARKHNTFNEATPSSSLDEEKTMVQEEKEVKFHQPQHREIPVALLARLRANNIITRLHHLEEELELTTERTEEEEVPHAVAKSAYIDCAMERLVPGYRSLLRQQQESLMREDMRTSLDPILCIADAARELQERGMPVLKEETSSGMSTHSSSLLAHRQLARSIRTRHIASASLGHTPPAVPTDHHATLHYNPLACENREEQTPLQNHISGTRPPPPSPAEISTPPPTPQSPTSSTRTGTGVVYLQRLSRGETLDREMSCQRTSSSGEEAELSSIGAPTERTMAVLTAKRTLTVELPNKGDKTNVRANASVINKDCKQESVAEAGVRSEVIGSEGVKLVVQDGEGGRAGNGTRKVRGSVLQGCEVCGSLERVPCELSDLFGRAGSGLDGSQGGKSPARELQESVEECDDHSFGVDRGKLCLGCELVGSEQHQEAVWREGSELEDYVAHLGCELCMASCFFLDRVQLGGEVGGERRQGCAEASYGVECDVGRETSVQAEGRLRRNARSRESIASGHGWREVLVESSHRAQTTSGCRSFGAMTISTMVAQFR